LFLSIKLTIVGVERKIKNIKMAILTVNFINTKIYEKMNLLLLTIKILKIFNKKANFNLYAK
jgi:hypothetical protein